MAPCDLDAAWRATWYCLWIAQGCVSAGRTVDEMRPGVVARMVMECPEILLSTAKPSEFQAYVQSQCTDQTWNLIRSEVVRECRLTMQHFPNWERWFKPDSPRRYVVQQLCARRAASGRSLLEEAWHEIHSGSPDYPESTPLLSKLLELRPIEALAKLARERHSAFVHGWFQTIFARCQSYNVDNPPIEQIRREVISLLGELRTGQIDFAAESASVWEFVCYCLRHSSHAERRASLPGIARLSESLAKNIDSGGGGQRGYGASAAAQSKTMRTRWVEFFESCDNWQTVQTDVHKKGFADLFVTLGAHLFLACEDDRAREIAAQFVKLKEPGSARLAWARATPAPTFFQRVWSGWSPPVKSHVEEAFCRPIPAEEEQRHSPDEWIVARAKFATCYHGRVDAPLADMLLGIAGNGADDPARRIAAALAGFVLYDGPARLAARAQDLGRDKTFRKTIEGALKRQAEERGKASKWSDVTAAFEQTLLQHRIPPEQASAAQQALS
jgi:hypothetical protein